MADNALYVAVAPTRSSAPISSGATSMTVAAIKDRLGNTLTMADFGSKGYGVISPGKDKEESFVFTGISGSTVSGISWVTMKSPYTETSGFNEAHAAGETVILYTNSPAFYNSFLNKNNDETIAGTYTFPSAAIPIYDSHPTFTDDKHIIDKKYADDLAFAGAPDGSDVQKGIYEAATAAESAAGTLLGGTGARLVITPDVLAAQIQSDSWAFGITAGTADALTVAMTPTVTALSHGMRFTLHNTTAINANATLNVDGLGAKAIYKYAGGTAVAVEANDMKAAYHHIVIYDADADVFLLVNPVNGDLTSAVRSEVETFFGATDITGTEAETLTGGASSNADSLHTHVLYPAFLSAFLLEGTVTTAQILYTQFCINAAKTYGYFVYCQGASPDIYVKRFVYDSGTGAIYYDGTTAALLNATYSWTGGASVVAGSTYVWVIGYTGTDRKIVRLDADLTNPQVMTMSGTADATTPISACGTDSILYIQKSTTTVLQYTISGTTATRGSDITLTTGGNIIEFDGTNLFAYLASSQALRKFSTSGGAASASGTYGLAAKDNQIAATADIYAVGLCNIDSTRMYLVSARLIDSATASCDGFVLNFTLVTKI